MLRPFTDIRLGTPTTIRKYCSHWWKWFVAWKSPLAFEPCISIIIVIVIITVIFIVIVIVIISSFLAWTRDVTNIKDDYNQFLMVVLLNPRPLCVDLFPAHAPHKVCAAAFRFCSASWLFTQSWWSWKEGDQWRSPTIYTVVKGIEFPWDESGLFTYHEPPKTKGFGHLKTKLFTIKTSNNIGFSAPWSCTWRFFFYGKLVGNMYTVNKPAWSVTYCCEGRWRVTPLPKGDEGSKATC